VFENVIQGIEEAQKVGLKIKLNSVILKILMIMKL
jgi:molybdenum cofactor biosynthesis enzyme MoaA